MTDIDIRRILARAISPINAYPSDNDYETADRVLSALLKMNLEIVDRGEFKRLKEDSEDREKKENPALELEPPVFDYAEEQKERELLALLLERAAKVMRKRNVN